MITFEELTSYPSSLPVVPVSVCVWGGGVRACARARVCVSARSAMRSPLSVAGHPLQDPVLSLNSAPSYRTQHPSFLPTAL